MLGLGELELKVMDVLWSSDEPLRVRDVMERLASERQLAYTTVMTVLDHLHGKEWVQRTMSGRAYSYVPVRTREEAGARLLREVLNSSGDAESVLLHFARSVSDRESEVLRRALQQGNGQQRRGES